MELLTLFVLAFGLEMVDNAFGGGFGTILSPLLVIFGYDPRIVVPAILVSETVSGLWGGAWHLKYHNVNFKAIAFTLSGSLISMAAATYLIGEILPSSIVKQYIGFMAVGMGALVIFRSYDFKEKQTSAIKYRFIPVLGSVIGFNKGGSGGGYGPLSVLGYMLCGIPAAVAIGTTTVAEGIACVLGVTLYSQLTGIAFGITLALTAGSFIADPISAWINNAMKLKLKTQRHSRLIGQSMTLIGIVSLLKAFGLF